MNPEKKNLTQSRKAAEEDEARMTAQEENQKVASRTTATISLSSASPLAA
jgi:hypothetical protein